MNLEATIQQHRHQWSTSEMPYVSRIEWGEPDEDGVSHGRLVDTRPTPPGGICIRCGVGRRETEIRESAL